MRRVQAWKQLQEYSTHALMLTAPFRVFALQALLKTGLHLLAPGTTDESVEAALPTTETEPSGMGTAMGGTVGGAIGVAGGASLGAAAASLLIPGVGPVIAGGLIGAALLGVGGAVTGAAAGTAFEQGLADGIPHDELYLYEDALRKGRSVVIAFGDDDDQVEVAPQRYGPGWS